MLICSTALMYGPALKALLAKAAGPDEQGALQGESRICITLLKMRSLLDECDERIPIFTVCMTY